ncbi:hypothetical protein [Halomicrobium salinisoli]|uniref:hypothetical protein n=1 Tax=Halomicrobium salinisoli TaxID=2878391 RepID=UPI001CF0116C|nr:hypothetical protein [Halomicrobium salinisoli]
MSRNTPPSIMVLDGDNANALPVATELSEDLDATIIGVGTSDWSRLLRSRHCDVGATTVHASHPQYAERVLELLDVYRPDLLLPLGHGSVSALEGVRDRLPEDVACSLPPSESLDIALDKLATGEVAKYLDVGRPEEYTDHVRELRAGGRPDDVADLPFPLFLKARFERGRTVTARVDEPSEFWSTYEDVEADAETEVVVQSYVPGDRTFGVGLLYDEGTPRLLFAHEEIQSVPRRGGTGTRVRVFRDPRIETDALRLLDSLDWHGPALVEFKRRPDGSYALMEINPKFWASYALASRSGYRFASTLAARALDLSSPNFRRVPDQTGEMVFPLQELQFAAGAADESVLQSAASMLWPPTAMDINVRDIGAWLTPPTSVDNVDALDTDGGPGIAVDETDVWSA